MKTYYVVFDNDAPLFVALLKETAEAIVMDYRIQHTKNAHLDPPYSHKHYFHVHEVKGDGEIFHEILDALRPGSTLVRRANVSRLIETFLQ